MRKIPKKNYIILATLIVSVVVVTLGLKRLYDNRIQKTSILYNFLSEVTLNDLDTYLSEQETAVIYIDDKYNLKDNKEEKKLKQRIIDSNLNNSFVFLDSNTIDEAFIITFKQKYGYTLKEEYPTIIVMNNKKVINSYNDLNVNSIDFEALK